MTVGVYLCNKMTQKNDGKCWKKCKEKVGTSVERTPGQKVEAQRTKDEHIRI